MHTSNVSTAIRRKDRRTSATRAGAGGPPARSPVSNRRKPLFFPQYSYLL